MSDDTKKKARAALITAAPIAINTLMDLADGPSNPVSARLSAINSLMRYSARIPWQSRAGFVEGLQTFLMGVADDRKQAYGTRQRARNLLSRGTILNLWKTRG
jgi:hypothetical protein